LAVSNQEAYKHVERFNLGNLSELEAVSDEDLKQICSFGDLDTFSPAPFSKF
jgi:hypothetical protein